MNCLLTSGSGTTPTYRDVCHVAAFRGEADSTRPKNFAMAAEQTALDMTKALKLERLHRQIGWLFSVPARRITATIFQYDRLVGSEGLATGSAWLLEQFTRFAVVGMPPPSYGPLLIVGNHPGMVDAMAICAQVPRDDLRILSAERPILRLLPNVLTRLIFVPDDPQRRLSAIRATASHLRTGGSLLTLPGGNIEAGKQRVMRRKLYARQAPVRGFFREVNTDE